MESKQPLSIVLCTVPDIDTANRIAEAFVVKKLAACVNVVGPIRSINHWDGKVENDTEYQLVIKTAPEYVDDGFTLINQIHPYDVCEWIVLDAAASEPYWNWMRSSLK